MNYIPFNLESWPELRQQGWRFGFVIRGLTTFNERNLIGVSLTKGYLVWEDPKGNISSQQENPDFIFVMSPPEKKIKYRNFLWVPTFGKHTVVCVCTYEEDVREPRENWKGFVRWLGDWEEVVI